MLGVKTVDAEDLSHWVCLQYFLYDFFLVVQKFVGFIEVLLDFPDLLDSAAVPLTVFVEGIEVGALGEVALLLELFFGYK